jgi:hypothetical protein
VDSAVAITALTIVVSGFTKVMNKWLHERAQSQSAREQARCDHVRNLPSGSRIVDLGRAAIVVEVGSTSSRGVILHAAQ